MMNLLKSKLFFGAAFIASLYLLHPSNTFVAGLLGGAIAYMVNWLVFRGAPTFKAALIVLAVSGACFVASLAYTSNVFKDALLFFGAASLVVAFAEAVHSFLKQAVQVRPNNNSFKPNPLRGSAVSGVRAHMNIGRRDILFLAVALLPSLAVAASALLLVPGSVAVYAPVTDHLPPQTEFVFSFYYLCALWPVLVVLVWYFWRDPKGRGPMAASISVLGSIVIGAFGWWAVYQPDLILELIERSAG